MSIEKRVWVSKVEEEGGELVVSFEQGMMDALGWKPGDAILWSDPDDKGNVVLRKLEK